MNSRAKALLLAALALTASLRLEAQTLQQQFQTADAELNRVYKALRTKLLEDEKNALRLEQRKWLAEMEEAAEAKVASDDQLLLRTSMTLARTAELSRLLGSFESSASAPGVSPKQQKASRETILAYLKKADEELNSVYQAALASLGPTEQAKLRQEQREWLKRASGGIPFEQHSDLLQATSVLNARTAQLKGVLTALRTELPRADATGVPLAELPSLLAQASDDDQRLEAIKHEYSFWQAYLDRALPEEDKSEFRKNAFNFERAIRQESDSKQLFRSYKDQISNILNEYRRLHSSPVIQSEALAQINGAANGLVSISDDASLVVTADDHVVRLWDAQTGLMIASYPFREDICGLQFDIAGQSVYVFHYDAASKYEDGIELARLVLATGEVIPNLADVRYSFRAFGTVPAAFLNPVTGQCHVIYHSDTGDDVLACKRFDLSLGDKVAGASFAMTTAEHSTPTYDRSSDEPDEVITNPFSKLLMGVEKTAFYMGTTGCLPNKDGAILGDSTEAVLTFGAREQPAKVVSLSREGAVLRTENGVLVCVHLRKQRQILLPGIQNQSLQIDYIKYSPGADSLFIANYEENLNEYGGYAEPTNARSFSSMKNVIISSASFGDAETAPDHLAVLQRGGIIEAIPKGCLDAILYHQEQTLKSSGGWGQYASGDFGQSPKYFIAESQFIARCVDGKDDDYYGIQDMTYWPKVSWSPGGEAVLFYGARYKGVFVGSYLFGVSQEGDLVTLQPLDEENQTNASAEESEASAAEISLGFYPYILHLRNGWVGCVDARNGKLVSKMGTKTGSMFWEASNEYPAFDLDTQGRRIFNLSASGGIDVLSLTNDGELAKILEIFPAGDSITFVTPEGFFLSRARTGSNLHFVREYETYPFEQFDLRLNRPDIVLDRLGAPAEAVAIAKQLREKRLKRMGVTEEMLKPDFHVPVLEIVGDVPSTTDADEISVAIKASDSKYVLERLRVYVNNVPVNGRDGESLRDQSAQSLERTIPIKLAAGRNKIQISVLNNAGAESLYANAEVNCTAIRPKPALYAVALGVSDYANPEWNLQYAAKDAKDVLERLKSRSAGSYGEVKELLLTDRQVTKESLAQIRDFLKDATIDDTVLMFVAGHGLLDSQYDYYFGTTDIDFNNPAEKGIAFEEFDDLLAALPCLKKSLLIDTCHAGELDEEEKTLLASAGGTAAPLPTVNGIAMRSIGTRGMNVKAIEGARGASEWYDRLQGLFVDLRRGSGSTILSSSAGAEYALESSEQQNGLFTYAVLEALDGKKEVDTDKDGAIEMSELGEYVKKRVSDLTNNKQTPNTRRANLEGDFTLAKTE
jgi:uncharacterized protein YecT (DUF1311 family)